MDEQSTTPITAIIVAGSSTSIDSNHSYHLHPSDAPGMTLINNLFDGKGYQGWRRFVLIALSSKNKLGFINGFEVAPSDNSPHL